MNYNEVTIVGEIAVRQSYPLTTASSSFPHSPKGNERSHMEEGAIEAKARDYPVGNDRICKCDALHAKEKILVFSRMMPLAYAKAYWLKTYLLKLCIGNQYLLCEGLPICCQRSMELKWSSLS